MTSYLISDSPFEWFLDYSGVDVKSMNVAHDVGKVIISGECDLIEDLDEIELCEMIGNLAYSETKDFEFATHLVQYLAIRFGCHEYLRLEEDEVCEVFDKLCKTIVL